MPAAAARLVCVTSPADPPAVLLSSQPHSCFLPCPPSPMLTGVLVLVGMNWNAVASASADCLLPASCPMAWSPPAPPCDCVADWLVRFRFPASAPASAALVWVTEPLLPTLPMFTG